MTYIYDASPSFTNCTLRHGDGDGIYIGSGTLTPTISNSAISQCGRYGINAYYGMPTITGNTFTNTGNYDIYLRSVIDAVVTDNTINRGLFVFSDTMEDTVL
jgi:hypothetical protein